MIRPLVKLRAKVSSKQNCSRPVKDSSTSKHTKKPELLVFYLIFSLILIAGKRFSQSHDSTPLYPII